MKGVGGLWAAVRDYFGATMRHPVGFIGINLTSFAGVLLVILLVLGLLGLAGNPYLGIVTFMVLPALFVLGLLLMPLSHYLESRRGHEAVASLFPVVDFNQAQARNRFVFLLVGTLVNLCILAVVSYRGLDYMDSVQFCGQTCHAIMNPEFTAYHNSPHARVRCVDCHIGPGASWFVKSKLSGTRQVFAAILKTYPRPIPTPVHNLRPARETCEQCHWPQRFVGTRLVVRTHYQSDEANTPQQTILNLKVGGGTGSSMATSIHWHVNNRVEYLSDESRERIYFVRATLPNGEVKEFFRPGLADSAGKLPDSLRIHPIRRMDCVDCHNRPTHIYKPAATALDEAMTNGLIPVDLPFLHREAMAALTAQYPGKPEALAGIGDSLRNFYSAKYPDVVKNKADKLASAVAGVQKIYADNVFPSMKIGWDTYPNHLGHQQSPGCFRCHDEELATRKGETISQDCSLCHTVLAQEEQNPAILKELFPEN